MRTEGDGRFAVKRTVIRRLDEIERLDASGQVKRCGVDLHVEFAVARIVERHVARASERFASVLDEDIRLALLARDIRLQAKVVLVHPQQVGIGDELQRGGGDEPHVAAEQQRRGHDAPHSEMGDFLVRGDADVAFVEFLGLDHAGQLADLQHVHVVVMSEPGVGAQVKVLGDDVPD